MKKAYILTIAVATVAALSGCQRIDPEKEMKKEIDLKRCLQPIGVDTKVNLATVTLEINTFPDAEKYLFELYCPAPEEGAEPAETNLVRRDILKRAQIPFTFTTTPGETMWYRVAALNETAGKAMSTWATGSFSTSEDPSVICIKPNCSVKVLNRKVTFNWVKQETDKYRFELTTADGNPVCARDLTNDDVPFSLMLDAETSYKYKVKAIDIAGSRADSKWVEKSFKTGPEYQWLESATSLMAAQEEIFSSQVYSSKFTSGTYIETTTVNNITFWKDCAWKSTYFDTRGYHAKDTQYGLTIPKEEKKMISFSLCRPGELDFSFKQASGGNITVAILTTKDTEKAVQYLLDDDSFSSQKSVKIPVSEDILYGSTEPAKVYLFSSTNKSIYVYSIKWTPETTE